MEISTLSFPLKLYLPLIHRLPVRFEPVQHIMLLKSMFGWIPVLTLNKLLHLIISGNPSFVLSHLFYNAL